MFSVQFWQNFGEILQRTRAKFPETDPDPHGSDSEFIFKATAKTPDPQHRKMPFLAFFLLFTRMH
jgi:hypothetical protein